VSNVAVKQSSWQQWHISLAVTELTLEQALASAQSVAAGQIQIPLIVKLIENPNFHIPGIKVFNGAVDLHDHDCIHILLGRGLCPKDEAFTVGFTMGSTNLVSDLESKMYAFASKNLYPDPYRFSSDDLAVYRDAVRIGAISDCEPLDQINYKQLYDKKIGDIRRELGIEVDLLRAYYKIESRRYPDCLESQRLLE